MRNGGGPIRRAPVRANLRACDENFGVVLPVPEGLKVAQHFSAGFGIF
jgi:hypothetical protein